MNRAAARPRPLILRAATTSPRRGASQPAAGVCAGNSCGSGNHRLRLTGASTWRLAPKAAGGLLRPHDIRRLAPARSCSGRAPITEKRPPNKIERGTASRFAAAVEDRNHQANRHQNPTLQPAAKPPRCEFCNELDDEVTEGWAMHRCARPVVQSATVRVRDHAAGCQRLMIPSGRRRSCTALVHSTVHRSAKQRRRRREGRPRGDRPAHLFKRRAATQPARGGAHRNPPRAALNGASVVQRTT